MPTSTQHRQTVQSWPRRQTARNSADWSSRGPMKQRISGFCGLLAPPVHGNNVSVATFSAALDVAAQGPRSSGHSRLHWFPFQHSRSLASTERRDARPRQPRHRMMKLGQNPSSLPVPRGGQKQKSRCLCGRRRLHTNTAYAPLGIFSRLRVQRWGFRVEGLGFRVLGSGFRV